MSEFEWDPAPIDSYDLYAMGLRPARCNGCSFAKKRWELGEKFLVLRRDGWVNVYEFDAEPSPGQGEPTSFEGRPIKYHAGYMSIGHSDECYHWAPPSNCLDGDRHNREMNNLSIIERILGKLRR